MDITGTGVKASDAGVYTFALDHFFLRVNTDGELVYYRYIPQYEVTVDDRSGDAENMAENFAAQDAVDGSRYYTAFIELEPTFRNAMGGFSSGYYLVMDDNYVDIDQATLKANSDEKHYHGQDIWISMSLSYLEKSLHQPQLYTGTGRQPSGDCKRS